MSFSADTTGADCSICELNTDFCMECIAMREAAYLAGVQAERERCLSIAGMEIKPASCNEHGEITNKYDCWKNGVADTQEQIAALIQKGDE